VLKRKEKRKGEGSNKKGEGAKETMEGRMPKRGGKWTQEHWSGKTYVKIGYGGGF